MTRYYFTTYTNPKKTQFFFTVTERMSGKVKHASATYNKPEEAEQAAIEVTADYERRAEEDEAAYIESLKGQTQ